MRLVFVYLALSPLGQLLKALPGEDARLDPSQALQPQYGAHYALHEQALQHPDGPQHFLQSTYRRERVQELEVLCDSRVRGTLLAEEIELCSFTSEALQHLDPAS
jgi:hypothetical protein